MQSKTNSAQFVGKVGEDIQINHKRRYGIFYKIILHVQRMSGVIDEIPMIVKDTILERCNVCKGSKIRVEGRVQRHWLLDEKTQKRQVKLYVQVTQMEEVTEAEPDKNEVFLSGMIWGTPNLRKTPFNKIITEFSIVTKGEYQKNYKIWCIAWGKSAYAVELKSDGETIAFQGRFQSRYYTKVLENGEEEQKITYEVSVMELIE